MKKVKILCLIAGLLLCSFGKISAQIERLDRKSTEVLVFIMPDSLELAPELKRGASVRQSTIKSQRLKTALEAVNVRSIAKAFPDWQEADSIAYTESGERVKKPEFHRVFTLSFASEQEADEAIKKLNGLRAVLYAEKHSQITLDNDPQYINGTQWHLENDGRNGGTVDADIDAEEAWNIFTGSSNITIGIFDTGVEISHDDLTGKATGDLPIGDGHGTQVAGVAAATANNGDGGRGVDWNARIRSYRVLNDPNIGDAELSAAIMDGVNQGVHVLNNSWSSSIYSSTIAQAFAYAYKMNRVAVATTGNTGITETRYPGALGNVIAVGATTNADVRANYSTMGNHIDVVAPGGLNGDTTNSANVHVPHLNNTYIFNGGTSFAAPQVSGLASLLKGYNNNLSNDDIEQIIELSADKVGPAGTNYGGGPSGGHNNEYGYGRINAGRALAMVRDNQLYHFTAKGGSAVSVTGQFGMVFIGAPRLASATYIARRYEVIKTITIPAKFAETVGMWARGVGTSGWSQSSPNYGEGFCDVIARMSGFITLRTYVYQLWNTAGQYMGCYPALPEDITFAYTVLGKPAPTITGPDLVCSGSSYTFTADNWDTGFSWAISDDMTSSNSGNSISVSAKNNHSSNGWIVIREKTGIELARKEIKVGPPTHTLKVTGPEKVLPVTVYPYQEHKYAAQLPVGNGYQWLMDEPTNGSTIRPNGQWAYIGFTPGVYYISCRAVNACGVAPKDYTNTLQVIAMQSSIIWPNPICASCNVATVLFSDIGDPYRDRLLEIYTSTGNYLCSYTGRGNSQTYSVRSLPPGHYILHVYPGPTRTGTPDVVKFIRE